MTKKRQNSTLKKPAKKREEKVKCYFQENEKMAKRQTNSTCYQCCVTICKPQPAYQIYNL